MTIELTPERALELMREVVAEYGEDYVYLTPDGEVPDGKTMCFYVHDDQPGCIAGHVYHRAGMSLTKLSLAETMIADSHHFYEFSADVRNLVTAAQARQDKGETWGEALATAEERFAEAQNKAE